MLGVDQAQVGVSQERGQPMLMSTQEGDAWIGRGRGQQILGVEQERGQQMKNCGQPQSPFLWQQTFPSSSWYWLGFSRALLHMQSPSGDAENFSAITAA